MRVAYVCADLGVPVFGSKGCSIHVQEIVRSFLKRGDQVDLFVARTGGEPPKEFSQAAFSQLASGSCRVHVFEPQPADSVAEREVSAQAVAERISEAMELEGRFDLVYERHSLWSSAGPDFGCKHGIPSILEINAPLIEEQRKHRDLVDVDHALATSQAAFARASSLAVVSDEVAKATVADFDIDLEKLHVVPNGVDTQRFSPDVAARLPSDDFTIGFVGSLKPWHGVETLLQAFQRIQREVPNSRLLIIGDGPLQRQLQRDYCTGDSNITSRVHWIGSVAPSEVPGYLNSIDVAVAPYPDLPDFYFSPLKVYEYMASGLTTVASDIGQLKSIIKHRVDGFLYKPSSVAALASTLSMLAEQPAVCMEVGRRARRRAVDEFSWDHVLLQSLETLGPQYDWNAISEMESEGVRCPQ
ncbi:MAG: glycosyltransferase family 4 protein [Pirellulaceae bacterium]